MVISVLLNGFVLFSNNTAIAEVICSVGPARAMPAFWLHVNGVLGS